MSRFSTVSENEMPGEVHQDDIKTAFVEILEEVANVNRTAVTGDHRLREDLGIDSLSLTLSPSLGTKAFQ